jgi:hypothetical protein
LQNAWPNTQVEHAPLVQICPSGQQTPLHSTRNGGQTQRPSSQVCPPMQTCPQPPQLLLSLIVATQVPPHSVGARAGQTHVLAMQVLPPWQTLLQSPQLFTSLVGSTHVPLQLIWPDRQHRPLSQYVAWSPMGWQILPQAPQLRSKLGSTHTLLQLIWPEGQHTPLSQCAVGSPTSTLAEQLLPQKPQFWSFVWVSTQNPPH